MPTTVKKTTETKKAAKAAKKSTPSAKTNGFHPGIYTVPRGHVSLAVPTFWTLRQTNDDIQVESEASDTAVIVTAYQRNEGVKNLDARDYLEHFLGTAPVKGKITQLDAAKGKAGARFRDEEGDHWQVQFLTNGLTLLLATCHTTLKLTSHEGRTGVAVIESIKLKARA
ncbi:MAG: hypothetical protein P4M01_08685 [Acidobacteriota bacterium]|nr:hypothetical protein [Acidobacteriota bacterium]